MNKTNERGIIRENKTEKMRKEKLKFLIAGYLIGIISFTITNDGTIIQMLKAIGGASVGFLFGLLLVYLNDSISGKVKK